MDKLLIIGVGSPSDLAQLQSTRIDGKDIITYIHDQGVKVYQHPSNEKHLTTSIHRTTQDALGYARDAVRLRDLGYAVATVLVGGLAFAMPGVFAAEAYNIPVIAVPMDNDAFYNVYKIPDGTAVGVVHPDPVNSGNLAKAVKIVSKMLQFPQWGAVNFMVRGKCPSADSVRSLLEHLVGSVNIVSPTEPRYDGVTVYLADTLGSTTLGVGFSDVDRRVELGIFGLEKTVGTEIMVLPIRTLNKSVIVGRPPNLALLAARVAGIADDKVAKKLQEYRINEAEKYPLRVRMTREHFQ